MLRRWFPLSEALVWFGFVTQQNDKRQIKVMYRQKKIESALSYSYIGKSKPVDRGQGLQPSGQAGCTRELYQWVVPGCCTRELWQLPACMMTPREKVVALFDFWSNDGFETTPDLNNWRSSWVLHTTKFRKLSEYFLSPTCIFMPV